MFKWLIRNRLAAFERSRDGFEVAEGDPIVIGTALVITGANESLSPQSMRRFSASNSAARPMTL